MDGYFALLEDMRLHRPDRLQVPDIVTSESIHPGPERPLLRTLPQVLDDGSARRRSQ